MAGRFRDGYLVEVHGAGTMYWTCDICKKTFAPQATTMLWSEGENRWVGQFCTRHSREELLQWVAEREGKNG